ncbi:MAG: hypothetical protein IPF44_01920 [Betaproteobacteria bacterium]|nr:hypothetical protein [Betaproteobacteria bacterium]
MPGGESDMRNCATAMGARPQAGTRAVLRSDFLNNGKAQATAFSCRVVHR